MSDAYEIKGVKITPTGGGYYDLTHPKLSEAVRERGKEAADQRAEALAKSFEEAEGHMEQQPPLGMVTSQLGAAPGDNGDNRTPAERAQEGAAGIAPPPPPAPPAEPPVADPAAAAKETKLQERLDAQEEANSVLQGQVKEMSDLLKQILGGAQNITQVMANAAPEDTAGRVPLDAPQKYAGEMSKEHKGLFKKAGFDVVTIVLEENESIPPTGLFIGHNGRSYQIVPGEKVDVPDFLLGVLDDAVMSAPVVDRESQKVLSYRQRSKYPYRRV